MKKDQFTGGLIGQGSLARKIFSTALGFLPLLVCSFGWVVSHPDASYAARRTSFTIFVGKDRRLKTINTTTQLAQGDTSLADGPVSVTLITPVNYKLARLGNNDLYYLDRTYTLTSIPASVNNKIWIMGNDADLMNNSSNFLQFEISDSARISVLVDTNSGRPSWLPSSYVATNRVFTTNNPAVPVYQEYRATFVPKGTIRFGGQDAATTGAACNYVVVVRRPANGDLGSDAQIASTQMQLPRVGHRLTKLSNGRILVTGGVDTAGALVMASELYDSTPQSFIGTGSLTEGRINPAVVKLNDGRVLAIGGDLGGVATLNEGGNEARGIVALSTCEIYDPSTGVWTTTGSMAWNRRLPEAIVLADGKVFVAGGVQDTTGQALETTEIFDPSTGLWTNGPNMKSPRYGHRMALLPDGRVLVVGGFPGGPELINTATTACDIFDPAALTISSGPAMTAPRGRFGMTQTGSGKFIAVGGLSYQRPSPPATNAMYVSTADVAQYDASTNTWTSLPPLSRGMYDFAVISPDADRVLVFAGYDVSGTEAGEVLLYDGILGTWTQVGTVVRSRSFPYSNGSDMVVDVGGKDFFLCGGSHYDETTGQTSLLYTGERFQY